MKDESSYFLEKKRINYNRFKKSCNYKNNLYIIKYSKYKQSFVENLMAIPMSLPGGIVN